MSFKISKTFEEWYCDEMKIAREKMSPKEYVHYSFHERYFKTGWDARKEEIEKLQKEIRRLKIIICDDCMYHVMDCEKQECEFRVER